MAASTLPSDPLAGLRVVECATYVAAPSGCMTLGQLGADVIRVDQLGGSADRRRWPLSSRTGASFYWSALNQGKRSVTVDLRCAEGQELLLALATAPGPDCGIVVDNSVGRPWLAHERLAALRADVIHVRIQGGADGRAAVDYTVNAEIGLPLMTGPNSKDGPVNHVLPAWDLLTGAYAASSLLAALRRRDRHGVGSRIEIALADVAVAGVANLGWLAEAADRGHDRRRDDNYVYGCYGADFRCRDGRDVIVVCLTARLWRALVSATGTGEVFAALERSLGVEFAVDGERYAQRATITAVLQPWFAARTAAEAGALLDAAGALWSPYRSMTELVTGFRRSASPEVLQLVRQPDVGEMIMSGHPARFDAVYGDARAAPMLGEHTDQVLADLLGLSAVEVARLHDRGVVGGELSARSRPPLQRVEP